MSTSFCEKPDIMEITFKVLKFMLLSLPWWTSDQVAQASPFTLCEWNFPQKPSENENTANHSLQVNCSGLGLGSAPSTLPSQIKSLDLSYNNITEIKRFDFTHHLCPISQLILSHNSLGKIDDGALSSLHGLQELNLSSNILGVVTEGMFQGLRNLKVLDLRHNQLRWIHKMAFTDLANLEDLWLQNNNLRTVPDAINVLTGLKTLSLGTNSLSQLLAGDLNHCPDLKILQLEDNQISTLAAEAFQNHENLKRVDLSFNQLGELHDTTVKFLWERGVDLRLHGNPLKCDCGSEQTSGGPVWLTDGVLCQGTFGSLQGERAPLRVHTTVVLTGVPGKSLTMPCRDNYNGRMVKYWKTPVGWLTSRSSCDSYSDMKCLCNGSLTILNFSCQYNGLYYCFQEDKQERVIIPYRVLALGSCQNPMPKPRLSREVKVDTQDTVSDSHFTAAVTSSVLVTFLGGFALGTFSRSHLVRCLQNVKSRLQLKGGNRRRTSEDNTDQISMRTSPSGFNSSNFRNEISLDGDDASTTHSSPVKAPRSFRSKREQAEESAHQEDVDSQEGSSSAVPSNRNQEPPGTNLPPDDQVPPRPARRSRVIKLYNYDEEGHHYGHIRDPEGDIDGAPQPKQRVRSLNRLNAIMGSVETPDLSTHTHLQTQPDPESELGQSSEEGSVEI